MDREKVIKAFEICNNNEDGIVCKNCPYKEDKWNGAWEDETGETCFQTLHADVLALLKEQEAEIEQLNRFVNGFSRDAIPVIRCKDCKQSGIDSTSYPQYWCSAHDEYHDGDWFCADGERKESW